MNSLERKKQRYLRRKKKRDLRNIERNNKYCNIGDVFCFHKVIANEILVPLYTPHMIYDI